MLLLLKKKKNLNLFYSLSKFIQKKVVANMGGKNVGHSKLDDQNPKPREQVPGFPDLNKMLHSGNGDFIVNTEHASHYDAI